MTSVKEIHIDEEPTTTALGRGTFTFTDAYSVFDWGQMPDPIPHKGASLCTMGAFNFERLESAGVSTHYLGVVPSDADEPCSLDDVDTAPTDLAFGVANRPPLPRTDEGYDYAAFFEAAGETYVIPLEVIFRNRVPIGSSLRRRTDPSDHALPYDAWPDEPVDLVEPIVEVSTKFEESDRYLDRSEATDIVGDADLDAVLGLAREVNRVVTDHATSRGFRHDDGKIEVVYHRGSLLVADVVGTFDENRFTYDGQQVSKEVVRQYYRRYDPQWIAAIDGAKAEAKATGQHDWRRLCAVDPTPLPQEVVTIVSDLYAAGANRYTDRELFEVDDLPSVIDRLQSTVSE